MFCVVLCGSNNRLKRTGIVLPHSCPLCKGDIEVIEIKTFVHLFFLPLFPINTEERYFCTQCNAKLRKDPQSDQYYIDIEMI